jgi:hypothetical protein
VRRIVFPLFVSMGLSMGSAAFAAPAGARGDTTAPGVAQDAVAGESTITKKTGAGPTDGAVNSAPVKARPVSRPQVRFAGFDPGGRLG